MPKIKQLSPHEAHKIAAGEVVERPANIVKELIENALDAQATSIHLYIEDGGKALIRVVDNGSGMDDIDARACFSKHATSKITTVDELETINTFGFRGEALASLAAVARITLITKEANAEIGSKVTVACNEITEALPTHANTGTDISIHDLFYTMPARRKFLKKNDTEWRHILQLFQAFCLSFPAVHFKISHDQSLVHNCPPVISIADRFAQLWQHHAVMPIDDERIDGSLSILGVISHHTHYRYDRTGIFFFVNNRWVKNFTLAQALLKGYQGLIADGRYPMTSINITIDPTLVDINIHPRKEEVAFLHPQKVSQLITSAVKKALEQKTSSSIHAVHGMSAREPVGEKFDQGFGEKLGNDLGSFLEDALYKNSDIYKNNKESVSIASDFNKAYFSKSDLSKSDTESTGLSENKYPENGHGYIANRDSESKIDKIAQPQTSLPADRFIPSQKYNAYYQEQSILQEQSVIGESAYNFTIIGQFKKTYILIEQEDGLFLVDQHAAHERILYERFADNFATVDSIQLLFPEIITLSPQDCQLVLEHSALFIKNGIKIEFFGSDQCIVTATPVYVKNIAIKEVVQQVIGWINESGAAESGDVFKLVNEKLQAQLACKAAIKAGDTLTHQQMVQLLSDLHKTAHRFSCPHGRPTGFLISLDEIEKKIKRKN